MNVVLPFPRRPAPLPTPSAASLRAAVRHVIGEEIERLIGLLDVLDGDADAESDLGWPEGVGSTESPGTPGDREDDAGDDREPDEDREPILGWTADVDQAGGARFGEPWRHDEDEASSQPASWRPASLSLAPRAQAGEA